MEGGEGGTSETDVEMWSHDLDDISSLSYLNGGEGGGWGGMGGMGGGVRQLYCIHPTIVHIQLTGGYYIPQLGKSSLCTATLFGTGILKRSNVLF